MRPHSYILQHCLHLIWACLLLLGSQAALAHESNPAIAILEIHEDNTLTLELTTNLEALISGVGPEHNPAEFAKAARYAALRKRPASDLETEFKQFTEAFLKHVKLLVNDQAVPLSWVGSEIPDNTDTSKARQSIVRFTATLSAPPKTLSWQWDKLYGPIALRIHTPDKQDAFNAYLESGAASEQFVISVGSFLGATDTEYPSWFKESFLEFKDDIAEASAEGKRLAILFYQDGCPYCNLLIERNLAQQDISQLMQSQLDVVALNMWGSRELVSVAGETYSERDFAAGLKVQYTPTMLFFNEQGQIVLRLNGYLPPPEFKRALNYVTGKQEASQSYSEYVAANPVSAAKSSLNSQDFFESAPYDLSPQTTAPKRPLAVFFEQKDCPACDTLHQTVIQDDETQKIISKFKAIQLDMWSNTPLITPSGKATTAKDWANALNINYAPSIVLFDPEGKEVIRMEALFKTLHTQSTLDYVLSGAYQTQPSFQKYLSQRADTLRESGQDVDIWK